MPYTIDEIRKMMQKDNLRDLDAYNQHLESIRSEAKERNRVKESVSARRQTNQNANADVPQVETERKTSRTTSRVSSYLDGGTTQKITPYAAKKQTKKTEQVEIPYLKPLQANTADTDTILNKALQDNYKMNKTEQKQVRDYSKKWLDSYSKKIRSGEISQSQAARDMTDSNSDYAKMTRLYNKSSSASAFALGLMGAATKLPGFSNVAGKIDDMGNGTYRQYDNLTEMKKNAQNQSPVAEGAGEMVGEMAKYQTANAIMAGIPAVTKAKQAVSGAVSSIPFLGGGEVAAKIGESTANVLSDLTLDTAFDTIPYLQETKQDGETAGQTASKALKRTGYNLGMNVAGEAIPYLVSGAGKAAKNLFGANTDNMADMGRKVADATDSARTIERSAETATDALKQADMPMEQLPELQYDFSQPQSAKQVENILTDSKARREFQQQSGVELTGTKSEQRRQVQEWLGMSDEERIANRISNETISGSRITDFEEKADRLVANADAKSPKIVGKATTIKSPYNGVVPRQMEKSFSRVEISDDYMAKASENILNAANESAKSGKSYRNHLKKLYEDLFGDGSTRISIPVDGVDFNGKAYIVDVNKSAIGKIVSDKNLTAEKLAVIDSIDDIVENAKYVGSGDYTNYKNLKHPKNVTRYDYFETEAIIKGEPYVVSFDVDVVPGANNYRTHKVINEINLTRANDAAETASKVYSPGVEVGPVPTASGAASGLTNNSISSSGEKINISDVKNDFYEGLPFDASEAQQTSISYLGDNSSRSAKRNINPDGTYASRTATNTLRNSELVKSVEGAMDDLEKGIKNGTFDIKPMSEKESIQRAADALDKDYAGELRRLSSETWTNGSRDVDEGMIILENKLKEASESGNFDDARAWMRKVVEQGSEKGKGLQAYAKYSRTAEGSLVKAQNLVDKQIDQWAKQHAYDALASKDLADNLVKEVDYLMESRKLDPLNPVSLEEIQKAVGNVVSRNRLSHDIDEDTITKLSEMLMKGSTASDIEKSVNSVMAIGQYGISDEIIEQVQDIFAQASKYGENSKARVDLENKAYALLANEVTSSSWSDKWDAWRYFAMLSSPTTHIRNMIGNTAMNTVTNVKDALGAVMESAVNAVSKDGISRTKALLNPLDKGDKALLEAAGNDAVEGVYRQLSGSKYSATVGIESQAKAFRGTVGSKFQKLLDANSDLLEKEDWIGLKKKYRQSLAGFLKANGADSSIFSATDDASKALLNRGRAYAINQAQEATFHEASKFAANLTEFSQNLKTSGTVSGGLAHAAIESVMPFKKTPVNILKQGIEYSPVGIVKGVGTTMHAVKDGSKTASEAIEQLAKGLTGSALLSLGAYLSSTGLLRGNGTGDKEQDEFDELQGAQNYALQIGDKSYTLDWMAPSILPVLVGAELQKAFSNGSDASDVLNAIGGIADPIIETSFMTGVSNALDAVQYADDGETLQTAGANMLMGYAQQGVPTALGKVARTFDNTRRSSLTDSTGMAGQAEYNLNKVQGKIPFLSQERPAYVDAWGRTQENLQGGNLLTNALYQFASPGYYSQKNTTPADEKLQELYDSTGDASVLPSRISRSYDGRRLTAKEYEQAQTIAGQRGYEMISGITETEDYMNLPDEDKAEAVNAMYSLAKAIALKETVGKDMSSENKKLYQIYQDGGPQMCALYYMYKNIKKTDDASKSKNLQEAMNQSDMSREEKQHLYNYLNPTTKASNNPYTESNQKISEARSGIQAIYDAGLAQSQTYASMSGTMRDDFDKKMDTFLNDYAAYNAGQKELSSTNQKMLKVYQNLGADGLAKYYVYKKNADFDGNGSLKKAEITTYLNADPTLSAYERRMWFSYLSKAKNPY